MKKKTTITVYKVILGRIWYSVEYDELMQRYADFGHSHPQLFSVSVDDACVRRNASWGCG